MAATAAERLHAEKSAAHPRPTNAQALAALRAFGWATGTADAAIAAGIRPTVARAFCLPLGVFPWLRLRTGGWRKRGGKLRDAESPLWREPFDGAVWNVVGTFVDEVAKLERAGALPGGAQGAQWNDRLAAADPVAVAEALEELAGELAVLHEEKADVCQAYKVPRSRGVLPKADPVCLGTIAIARRAKDVEKIIPRRGKGDGGTLVVVGLVYILTRRRRKKRA